MFTEPSVLKQMFEYTRPPYIIPILVMDMYTESNTQVSCMFKHLLEH